MQVSLFIPCYMDQLYPNVAMATLTLLEKHGCTVSYPMNQTCCGQPMANTGCSTDTKATAKHFIDVFKGADYVVCPSGSCVSMVREHYTGLVPDTEEVNELRSKTYELCEFLTGVLKVEKIDAEFNHKVGLHQSCHGLRELRLGSCSEQMVEKFSKAGELLNMVKGIELVEPERPDECCGFGGTFAVAEKDVSCLMGEDRINDHERAGAEVIVGYDSSCLMHMGGISKRQKRNLKFMHIAEILNGAVT
ncbi:MAG: (Fe-S)-binding protein [Lentisphaeraceae bacterium]|nr:(Fe-S)-binding protein [Lentisphaeraceae bacterium]